MKFSCDPYHPGSAFIKPDQYNPWIKDQIKITIVPTISYLQLPNFERQALPHDTKFGNSRCEIVDSRAFPSWSLIHGLRWSGLIKAEPGSFHRHTPQCNRPGEYEVTLNGMVNREHNQITDTMHDSCDVLQTWKNTKQVQMKVVQFIILSYWVVIKQMLPLRGCLNTMLPSFQ